MEGLTGPLKDLSRQAQSIARELARYETNLDNSIDRAYERAAALGRLGPAIARLPSSDIRSRLEAWLAAETAETEKAKTEFRFQFSRRLVAALEGSNLAVKGQLPRLRVGMLTLLADFDAGGAALFWGPEVEKVATGLTLDPSTLSAALRTTHEELAAGGIKPDRLLPALREAYRRVLRLTERADGTRVFLLELLPELVMLLQPERFRLDPARARFVEYPRVQFSYDLYRLRRAGTYRVADAQLKLCVANFDATTEKAKALWVPDNDSGDGTHYSYASFGQ